MAAGGARPRLLLGRADGLERDIREPLAGAAPALRSAFAWTIGYDTIYALQDARDDAIVGIRSTARLFGARVRLGVSAVLCRGRGAGSRGDRSRGRRAVALVGWLAYCGPSRLAGSQVEGADAATALRLFRSNRDAGLILFAGIALQGWVG